MTILIVGLLIFLGMHSLRVLAGDFYARAKSKLGTNAWKAIYALISIAGFLLIIWGFSLARQQPVLLYSPVPALKHANALFTLIAFVLVVAAYVPRNHFKTWIGHPMLAGTKVWALGHLLATGFLHDVVLFGAFLIWAVVLFVLSRRRDRRDGMGYPPGGIIGDIVTLVLGIGTWAGFAFWAHLHWIGVNPFA